jgi:hypothetical protein
MLHLGQTFCEKVGYLVIRGHVLQSHLLRSQHVAYEMMTNVDMLAPGVECGVLRQSQ